MRLVVLVLLLSVLYSFNAKAFNCTGKFFNPVSDVNWSCMMPITIGNVPFSSSGWLRPDTLNPPSPICLCPKPGFPAPVPGISIGIWEPIRLVDVTKKPFCFPNMGGEVISPISGGGVQSVSSNSSNSISAASWYTHWYISPVLSILGLIIDSGCLERSGFDLAYIAELDPTWNDDALSLIFSPEAALFSNVIAQAACAADCVAANVHLPLDILHWCAGCQGGMYPMNGNIASHQNSIQSSLTALQRTNYKLHRTFLSLVTSGPEALCQSFPSPIIKKSQYRTQITNPVPGLEPNACAPYGRSSVFWESFKEIPVSGEDFGYLIWRKKNCCWL